MKRLLTSQSGMGPEWAATHYGCTLRTLFETLFSWKCQNNGMENMFHHMEIIQTHLKPQFSVFFNCFINW